MSAIDRRLLRLEQGAGGAAVIYIVAVSPDGTQGPPCEVRAMGPGNFDYLAAIKPLAVALESDTHEHREAH